MRISTSMMFRLGTDAMTRQQSELLRTQQQMAANRRILSPSDDPVAAAQALRVEQQKSLSVQQTEAQGVAKSRLGLLESRLADAGDALKSARTLGLQAGNGSLTPDDRRAIAREIRSIRDELLSIANTRDGDEWLFAGTRTGAQPFVQNAGGVTYVGDDQQRAMQVASGRQLPVSESGSVFDRVRDGNGTFAARAAAGNTGTGRLSAGSVADPNALDTNTYSVQFNVTGGVTTYDVLDTTNGTTVSTGNAYTSGSAVTVAGMRVEITGNPAQGDAFTLRPSTDASVFDILDTMATAIETGATTGGNTALTNALTVGVTELDQAHGSVLDARTDVGARLREIDAHANATSADAVAADARLLDLTGLDYAEATTRLARQSLALEAAQQSYAKISGLSLFNFL